MDTLRELAGYVCEPKLFQKPPAQSRIILFSIHQPTSDIFHLFTNIILMNAGRIIFHGTVQEAQSMFTSMGMICPPRYNPAEFYVSKISDPRVAEDVVRHVATSKSTHAEISQHSESSFDERPKEKIYRVSWIRQVFLLSHRATLSFLRSPRHYFIELLILIVNISGQPLETFRCQKHFFSFFAALRPHHYSHLLWRVFRLRFISSRYKRLSHRTRHRSLVHVRLRCFLFIF